MDFIYGFEDRMCQCLVASCGKRSIEEIVAEWVRSDWHLVKGDEGVWGWEWLENGTGYVCSDDEIGTGIRKKVESVWALAALMGQSMRV